MAASRCARDPGLPAYSRGPSLKPLPSIGRSLALYIAGFSLDVFLIGLPLVGVLFLSVAGSGYLVEANRLRRSDPADAWRRLRRGLLALTFVGAIVAGFAANTRLGSKGAEEIARALRAHQIQTGRYPVSLEALVPQHLKSLPAACFGLQRCGYRYSMEDGKPTLTWIVVPPVWMSTYSFEEGQWSPVPM